MEGLGRVTHPGQKALQVEPARAKTGRSDDGRINVETGVCVCGGGESLVRE